MYILSQGAFAQLKTFPYNTGWCYDVSFRADYSDHRTFGRICLAMTTFYPVADAMALVRFILDGLDDPATDPDELLDALRDPQQAPLGQGSVLYWPDVILAVPCAAHAVNREAAPVATTTRAGRPVCAACAASFDLMEQGA